MVIKEKRKRAGGSGPKNGARAKPGGYATVYTMVKAKTKREANKSRLQSGKTRQKRHARTKHMPPRR
jgi:hypothetical protein